MENRPWLKNYDYNVPTTIRYPRLNAHELLGLPASAFPDKAATNFFGTEITFYELRQQVLRMANALGALGVQKGERVGLHLPTSPQYVIAYYAALSLGAIGVNLNPMYTADELKGLAANTGLTTLFTFDKILPNIRALCRDVDIPRVIVTRVRDKHPGGTGPGRRLASFLAAVKQQHQDPPSEGSCRTGRSRPDSIYRRYHGPSQRRRADPRQSGGSHHAVCALGQSDDRADGAGKEICPGRFAILSRLRRDRCHELGHVQLRHPNLGAAV